MKLLISLSRGPLLNKICTRQKGIQLENTDKDMILTAS